jgi:4-amino-4-deoxy-L-arabinose transferase-like glycosyltransferase
MTERGGPLALIALIALFSLLLFVELPGSELIEPDEARYAEIPIEMVSAGDLVTPRLNGTKYYEKPPLLYWANAASFAVLGQNPFAARLPVRLAALGTAALVAVALGGELGLWAALILLSAPFCFALGRFNLTDGVLTFGMTLALVSMRSFLRDEHRMRSLALLGLGCALAVLAKGLIGIVLPGLIFLSYVGIMREWRRLSTLLLSPAPVVFLAVAAPWFVLMEQRNPGFSQVFFVREHLQRFATNEAGRAAPFYFFVLVFLVGFLPWTLPFGAWLSRARPRWTVPDRAWLREHADEIFFVLWFVIIVVFFSASKSKLLPYILPAMPAAAALTARVIVTSTPRLRTAFLVYASVFTVVIGGGAVYALSKGLWAHDVYGITTVVLALMLVAGAWSAAALAARDHRKALVVAALGWGGLYLALVLALPRLSHDLTSQDIARAAGKVSGARVVGYRVYPQSFALTLGHAIPVVDYEGELASDGVRPPELFWSGDDFFRRWKAGEPMAVVLRRRALNDWTTRDLPPPATVAENKEYVVVTNVTSDSRDEKR